MPFPAIYMIVFNHDDEIRIRDLCDGNQLSVTNGAEGVIEELIREGLVYGDKIVSYIDTEGDLDILKHNGKEFTGFAPYTAP